MDKPGRNDLCYCGSGLKYKKCHYKIDQEAEQERRRWIDAANFLRRDLLAYARDEQFAAAFATALPFYWQELYTLENAEEMSQPEALRFFDWFMFDYEMPDGERPLTHYHRTHHNDLSTIQQEILTRWLTDVRPAWVYTLTDYTADHLDLRDFTTGEAFAVHEPGGRGLVEIGELILTRLLPVHDHLEFSTTAAYLPAAEIGDLAAKLAAARQADPDSDDHSFQRRHNHLLIHHALEQARLQNRPPVARLDPRRTDKTTQKIIQTVKRRVK